MQVIPKLLGQMQINYCAETILIWIKLYFAIKISSYFTTLEFNNSLIHIGCENYVILIK